MNHVFKRKEEKYILPLAVADNIQTVVKKELHFSEFNNNGELTDIRTTYLENDDFLIYHLKKSKKKKRYKVRIREYGKNGHFEQMVWMELKEKIKGQGFKSRFKIDRKYIGDFINGNNVMSYVLLENSGVERNYLLALYNRIQGLILENNLYPRLVMQYERLALQGEGSKGVRLTFDYNLKGGILNKNDSLFTALENVKYFDQQKSIAELKIGGVYPDEADSVKEKYSLNKKKFSKFVYGMESFYTSFNQEPEKLNMKYTPMSDIFIYDKEFAI